MTTTENLENADLAIEMIMEILYKNNQGWDNINISYPLQYLANCYMDGAENANSENQKISYRFLAVAMAKLADDIQEKWLARMRQARMQNKNVTAMIEAEVMKMPRWLK